MQRFFIFLIIFLFYFWTATDGTYKLNLSKSYSNVYNSLVNSFLKSRLDLQITPPKELLELQDPYNIKLNKSFRQKGFQDISLYKGKLYLYFGPSPVLLFYLPFYLLTKLRATEELAAMVFMFGAFIFGFFLITDLREKYFKESPNWLVNMLLLSLGFLNLGPFLCRHTAIYEVAISCGCFCLTGSIYFFVKAITDENLRQRELFLGSLFLGLAIGSRLYYVFGVIVLLVFISFLINKSVATRQNPSYKFLVPLFMPFLFCLVLHMIYNYLRFDNVFENGNKYALTSIHAKYFCPEIILSNLYYYLFYLPRLDKEFPFVVLNFWRPPFYLAEGLERIVGMLFGIPFLLFLILIPPLIRDFKKCGLIKNIGIKFPLNELLVILLPAVVNFILLIGFQYVTLRYTADFLTLFIIAAVILIFHFDLLLITKKYFRLTTIIVCIASIYLGIAISITGPIHGLK
ncbi:MAG: hypothetical protein HYY52_06510 [Candidatus Melainabacteria bacterium]|nr:hypothetical protein [Candidatus Melainabacteria bacterium]